MISIYGGEKEGKWKGQSWNNFHRAWPTIIWVLKNHFEWLCCSMVVGKEYNQSHTITYCAFCIDNGLAIYVQP